ncbi:MAG: DUF929 family protein [Candidatus Micrarchaeota archaeon]|nr:DUF929 family protein [Candidatus Micrarchaeota archaeon]
MAARNGKEQESLRKTISRLKMITNISLFVGIAGILLASGMAIYLFTHPGKTVYVNVTTSVPAPGQGGPGNTLKYINEPLNATELAIINNAPQSYFSKAAEMFLNGSIQNTVSPAGTKAQTAFNPGGGKAPVIYLGSITCIFCGENRWSMALALSQFGSFKNLYNGYSALGDADVPTLYWTVEPINSSNTTVANEYSSNYLTFVSMEDTNPITGGFALNPLSKIASNVDARGNSTATAALNYVLNISANASTAFQGTPYTVWGNYVFLGADAVAFGNSTPSAGTLPLTTMTHKQVLAEIASPNDQFAWTEYAGADAYIVAICKSINNTAPICGDSAIRAWETRYYS